MADYQGKFQYLDTGGAPTQQGACRIRFAAQNFTLSPEGGASLVFDLGDLDAVTAADYEIRLPLYTGRTLVLRQLGRVYETLAHDLLESYRNRTVQCLLLEDMGEIDRFTGNFELSGTASGAASGVTEIRLYKSNLAVLPVASRSFQWRLADVDEVKLDSSAYEVTLRAGDERLKVSRLARRTEEFASKVREAVSGLATESTEALHSMFPFLDPDQLQSCSSMLREGQSASLAKLAAIHKQIPVALAANAVDKDLKPYYDLLLARAAGGSGYAGFKLIRAEDGSAASPADEADSPAANDADEPMLDADASAPETLYWFLFPLAANGGSPNVIAWEASSKSGRATYFFRFAGEVDAAVRRLNRVLAMLNFRRRPIYLSDDELAMNPRFHRYAIAARRLAEVREVRASFLGRALHASPEAWQGQVEGILAKAEP